MALIRSHKQGWAVALFAIGLFALYVVPSFGVLPFLVDQAVQRLLLFGLVALFVAALGGARALAPSSRGLSRTLREGFYTVGVALALCGIEMVSVLELASEGAGPSPTWLLDLIQTAALCVTVGLYEEALFRVLLLGGLLSRHGGTRGGLVASVLISSIVFGMAHVTGSASLDPFVLVQMLLKTAQTGCIGLLFGIVYLRTRSFFGVVALHALADFFLMVPTVVSSGADGLLGSYVSEGTGYLEILLGVSIIVTYVVVIALYAPAAARAWKMLESAPVPEAGPLDANWAAPEAEKPLFPDHVRDERPPRPSGL